MGTLSRGLLSRDVKKSTYIHEPHFYIQGVMSDADVIDREHEVVDSSSFPAVIEDLNNRTRANRPLPIVIEHRRQDFPLPIGCVEKAWQEGSKLMFKGKISNSPIGKCIQDLIREGILYGCSIGGDPLKKSVRHHEEYPWPVSHIEKMKLDELSLTGLPVNEAAIFGMAKSLNVAKTKIQKALKRLDDAINLSKALDTVEAMGEKKADLDPADIERLKQSLQAIANVMGVELGERKASSELAPGVKTEETKEPEESEEKEEKPAKGSDVPEYDLEAKQKDSKNNKNAYKKEISENKLRCRHCELETDADADFDSNFCPACGSKYEHDLNEDSISVTCPRCKSVHDIPKSREHEANFCPRCGQKYPAEDTDLGKELKVLRRKPMAKEKEERREEEEEDEQKAAVKKAVASKRAKEEEEEEEPEDQDLEAGEKEEEEEEEKKKSSAKDEDEEAEEEEEEEEKKKEEEGEDEEEDEEGGKEEEEEEEEKKEEGEDEEDDEEDADEDDEDDEEGGKEEEEEEEKKEEGEEDDEEEDEEDADEGYEKEEEKDADEGYLAERDEDGSPHYRCMDCDLRMYDLEDDAGRRMHLMECRKSLFPCPRCGTHYNFNKSMGRCPIRKCRHNAVKFAKNKLVSTLKAYRGIYKSMSHVQENLRRLGLNKSEIGKALASIAVASQPKGAKTSRHAGEVNPRAAKEPGPSGFDIAVASQPKGSKTSYSNKSKKKSYLLKNLGVEYPKSEDTGYDWDNYDKNYIVGVSRNVAKKQQGYDEDVWAGTKNEDVTKGEQSNLQGFERDYVQMGKGNDKLAPVLNYAKVGKALKSMKALESRIDEKLDHISKIVRNNSTKKSLIADAGETSTGPSSEEVQEAANRHFAGMLLGKRPA